MFEKLGVGGQQFLAGKTVPVNNGVLINATHKEASRERERKRERQRE